MRFSVIVRPVTENLLIHLQLHVTDATGRVDSTTIFAASSLNSGVNDRRFFDTDTLSSEQKPSGFAVRKINSPSGVGVFVVSVAEAARVDESVARVLAAKKACG